jgi:molybdopterin-guanine dinucleotide biosynthesis protein A
METSWPAVGAVLAGGAGSRIGGAKALVELAGKPLIHHPIAAVEAAGLKPVVVAKPDTALPPLSAPVIVEPEQPRHPLCGIVAALRHAGERGTVVLGCDMPFATPALLRWLASTGEALVVPVVDGRPQALLARYDPALLPELERALASEEPLQRTIASLRPRLVTEEELARFGDPQLLSFNVNTPADVERAEQLLAAIEC